MEINKKRCIGTGILAGIFILFFSNYVCAFAVSSAYGDWNPLEISPGQTKTFDVILQNSGSDELGLKGGIAEGSEIAEITNPSEVYLIPKGEKKKITIRVSIPSDAKIGDSHNIKLLFSTVKSAEGGGLGFGSSIEQTVSANVIKKPLSPEELAAKEKAIPGIAFLISLIFIVIIIVIVIIIRKKAQEQPITK